MLKAHLLKHKREQKKLFFDNVDHLKYKYNNSLIAAYRPQEIPGEEYYYIVMVTWKTMFKSDNVAVIALKIIWILGVDRDVEKILGKTKCEKWAHIFHMDKRYCELYRITTLRSKVSNATEKAEWDFKDILTRTNCSEEQFFQSHDDRKLALVKCNLSHFRFLLWIET